MKRSFKNWWNRPWRRRSGLSRRSRGERATFDGSYRAGSFGKPRLGRNEQLARARQWLWRLTLAALAFGLVWVLWQSWFGLRVFDN